MRVSDAQNITNGLLHDHGLFDKGWRFKLARGKNTLGTCSYKNKTIRISRHLIENETDDEKIVDVILHEIAHALTPGHGHDFVWRMKAREIGLENPTRTTDVSYEVPYKYGIWCNVHGGQIAKRHRRMKAERLAACHCKRCGRNKSKGELVQYEI